MCNNFIKQIEFQHIQIEQICDFELSISEKNLIQISKLAYALFFITLGTILFKCRTYFMSKIQFSEKAYAAYINKTLYLHIGTDENRKRMSLKK